MVFFFSLLFAECPQVRHSAKTLGFFSFFPYSCRGHLFAECPLIRHSAKPYAFFLLFLFYNYFFNYFAECHLADTRQRGVLPSVISQHSAKYFYFFLLASKLFLLCSNSTWNYMFKFSTFLEVFAIFSKYISFN
jgi:hypothetical protein